MLQKLTLKKSLIERKEKVKQELLDEMVEDLDELDFKIPIIRTRSWWDIISPYQYVTYVKPIIEWNCDERLHFKLSKKDNGYNYGLNINMWCSYSDPTIDEEQFSKWETDVRGNFINFKKEIVSALNKHVVSVSLREKELS